MPNAWADLNEYFSSRFLKRNENCIVGMMNKNKQTFATVYMIWYKWSCRANIQPSLKIMLCEHAWPSKEFVEQSHLLLHLSWLVQIILDVVDVQEKNQQNHNRKCKRGKKKKIVLRSNIIQWTGWSIKTFAEGNAAQWNFCLQWYQSCRNRSESGSGSQSGSRQA